MERLCKGPRVRCDTTSPGARPFERSAELLVEFFLKTRDGPVKAQDFRCKGVVDAEFFRPCDTPLPFAPRHGAILHADYWSPTGRLTHSHKYGTVPSCGH